MLQRSCRQGVPGPLDLQQHVLQLWCRFGESEFFSFCRSWHSSLWAALGIAAIRATTSGYLSPAALKALPGARACSFSSLALHGPLSSFGLGSPSSLYFCCPSCSYSGHSLRLSSGFLPSDQAVAALSHLHLSPQAARPGLFLSGQAAGCLAAVRVGAVIAHPLVLPSYLCRNHGFIARCLFCVTGSAHTANG